MDNKALYLSLIVRELAEEFSHLSHTTLAAFFTACVWRLNPGDRLSLALDKTRHVLRQPPEAMRKALG
jgi:hypothetical protein